MTTVLKLCITSVPKKYSFDITLRTIPLLQLLLPFPYSGTFYSYWDPLAPALDRSFDREQVELHLPEGVQVRAPPPPPPPPSPPARWRTSPTSPCGAGSTRATSATSRWPARGEDDLLARLQGLCSFTTFYKDLQFHFVKAALRSYHRNIRSQYKTRKQ